MRSISAIVSSGRLILMRLRMVMESPLIDPNIICRNEEIQGALAKIMTSLYMSDEEIKIKFYMHQQASEWKIYDVLLDNGRFSLVSSYRAQLHWLLHTSSFEELLRVIREKN